MQTSKAHFRRIERTRAYKVRELAKKESIDWATSTLFCDIMLDKKGKNTGMQFHKNAAMAVGESEEGGNQVTDHDIK